MSGGKGGGTSTTTQSIPKWVEDEYKYVVGQAKDIDKNTSFQPYNGEFVAPLSTTQQAGIQNVNQAQGMALPAYGYGMGLTSQAAQGVTPQFSQAGLQPYMSPYLNNVVGSTMANINEQNASQRNALAGSAIAKGAYGGDRYGIQQAELARQQGLSTGQTIGNLYQSGYGQALGQYNQNIAQQQADQQRKMAAGAQIAQLGTGAQNAALSGAQAQLMAGAQEQATRQALDQALYNQFLQQQAYPFQKTSWLANIVEGIGSQSGGTSSTTAPSQSGAGSIIGPALSAAAMFMWSDERLKEDKEVVGETFDGQPIYKYRMKDGSAPQLGLMAQDVEKVHPEAVRDVNGYKQVNYDAATHDAAERGHFASGGLVPMGFAAGGNTTNPQFGMIPYVALANGLGYVPQANIPVGKSTIPKPPPLPQQDSNAAQIAKGLQAMPQGAKNAWKNGLGFGESDASKALGAMGQKGNFSDLTMDKLKLPDFTPSADPSAYADPGLLDALKSGLSGLFGGFGFADGGVVPRHHFQQGGDAPVSETPAADELRALMAQKEETVVVPVKTETGVVPVEIPKSEATGVVEPKNRTLGGYKKASEVATGNDVYAQLHPEFAPKFRQFIEEANRQGMPISPGSLYRSPSEQASLKAAKLARTRGAYQNLPVANPYESPHNYALAGDFAGYKPEYKDRLGKISQNIGLVYGGEFGDPIHVQLGRNFGQLKPHAYDERGNFNRNFQLPEAFLAGLQNQMSTQTASAPSGGVGNAAPASGGLVVNDPDMPSRKAYNVGFNPPPADWTSKGLGDRIFDTEGAPRSLIERVIGSPLSDEARAGLMAAGLGMMASRARHAGQQIGEGGLGGLQTYYNALANKQAYEKQQAEMGFKERETAVHEGKMKIDEFARKSTLLNVLRQQAAGYVAKDLKVPPELAAQIDSLLREMTGASPSLAPSLPPVGPPKTQPTQDQPAPTTATAATGEQKPATGEKPPAGQPAGQPAGTTTVETKPETGNKPPVTPSAAITDPTFLSKLDPDSNPKILRQRAAEAAMYDAAQSEKLIERARQVEKDMYSVGFGIGPRGEQVPIPGWSENKAKEANVETNRTYFDKAYEQFKQRQDTRSQVDAIANIVTSFKSGAFAEEKGKFVAALRSAGIYVPSTATANPEAFQTFMKDTMRTVMSQVKEMGAGQPRVYEMQAFERASANPTLEPQANKKILSQAYGIMNLADDQYKAAVEYRDTHGLRNFDQATFTKDWFSNSERSPTEYIKKAEKDLAVRGATPTDINDLQVGHKYILEPEQFPMFKKPTKVEFRGIGENGKPKFVPVQ